MLRHLAGKGYIAYKQDGPRYLYFPLHRPNDARRSALAFIDLICDEF